MTFRKLALSFACVAACSVAAAQHATIGVAPTYDGGGDSFGVAVAQHLTLFTYEDLLKSQSLHPVLLGPGGVYTPLDTSWLTDFVHDRPEIDLLLTSTLKPIVSPDRGKWTVVIDLVLLDAHTGATRGKWSVTTDIKGRLTTLDNTPGQAHQDTIEGKFTGAVYAETGGPSRKFEKQPLGKATAKLAEEIRDSLPEHMQGISAKGTPPTAPADGAPCPVQARIAYGYKHTASKSYLLLVNGLDQSTSLDNGISHFKAAPGEMVLQFSINDAPYRMVKENLYQLSTVHSCSTMNLTVDLGASGDAHIRWD